MLFVQYPLGELVLYPQQQIYEYANHPHHGLSSSGQLLNSRAAYFKARLQWLYCWGNWLPKPMEKWRNSKTCWKLLTSLALQWQFVYHAIRNACITHMSNTRIMQCAICVSCNVQYVFYAMSNMCIMQWTTCIMQRAIHASWNEQCAALLIKPFTCMTLQ